MGVLQAASQGADGAHGKSMPPLRSHTQAIVPGLALAARDAGVAVTYDNDNDFTEAYDCS